MFQKLAQKQKRKKEIKMDQTLKKFFFVLKGNFSVLYGDLKAVLINIWASSFYSLIALLLWNNKEVLKSLL